MQLLSLQVTPLIPFLRAARATTTRNSRGLNIFFDPSLIVILACLNVQRVPVSSRFFQRVPNQGPKGEPSAQLRFRPVGIQGSRWAVSQQPSVLDSDAQLPTGSSGPTFWGTLGAIKRDGGPGKIADGKPSWRAHPSPPAYSLALQAITEGRG